MTAKPSSPAGAEPEPASAPSRVMVFTLAAASGAAVASIYYAQPLVGPIGAALHLTGGAAGLIVTLTQIGYGLGLVLLVPLGDLMENRRLVVLCLICAAAALLLTGLSPNAALFLAGALAIGFASTAAQMLVPIAAHMSPEAVRGRVVGEVMSGLLTGILLARPAASLIAYALGWRAVFFVSAAFMIALTLLLARVLPQRHPQQSSNYGALLRSLGTLLRTTPVLRRRAAYQACLFAAFSLFWTTVPLLLEAPPFGFSQRGIALFALAGAAGALIAPVAGRLADRGWGRAGTGAGLLLAVAAFAVVWIGGRGSVGVLAAGVILLDLCVQANQVFGQREIYNLAAGTRSRLNGLFVALFFIGGAVGSATGGAAYAWGGWSAVCALGAGFCLLALGLYAGELWPRRR